MRELIATIIILFGIDIFIRTQKPEYNTITGLVLIVIGLIYGGLVFAGIKL